MKVNLIDYQKNALELLIHTKSTRLAAGQTVEEIEQWPHERKISELEYIRHTISSSWEFVRYIFEITGVSRVTTHQLVRTRTQSYAQESQRTIDASGAGYYDLSNSDYTESCESAFSAYKYMQNDGVANQDARYVLPEGTLTNIIVGTDLRTLSHTAEVRLCKRTAGEYQEMFKLMKAAVLEVHPWADKFIEVHCVKTGLCCFPNYKACPVQKYTVVISDERKEDIKMYWNGIDHVANPVAKDGRTM